MNMTAAESRSLTPVTMVLVTDQFRCDVNPFTGHEVYFKDVKPTAETVKTVWIAGGGPGGMTAAITAAERGHKVTLFEASDALGGALKYTDKDQKFKRDLHLFKERLIARVGELDIDVRLNTRLTPELVKEVNPDILVLTAAGISNGQDVYNTIIAGADATGSSSGVAKAADRAAMVDEMIAAVRRAWDERHTK